MSKSSYENQAEWRIVNEALPPDLRIPLPHPAEEEWYRSDRFEIHLDRWNVAVPRATAIIVHGAGGNGRMLGPYARICTQLGINAIAPDLPGYGLT